MASDAANPVLRVSGVVAAYGESEPVLRGIDLTANAGEITAIIGPNGSGKSSLLRAVCGLMRRRAGTISLADADITRMRPRDMHRYGIRYVPQGNGVFPNLSVQDNLRLAGWALRVDNQSLRSAVQRSEETFEALRTKRRLRAGYLSGGEQRQLEFARTAMGSPRLILLDEPSAGLSPKMATAMYHAIAELRQPDRVVVLVDQNVPKALEVSDVVYELALGRVTRRLLPGEHEARSIIENWLRP